MEIFDPHTFEILMRLGVAMLLGMIIGVERYVAHRAAGMRTYALVSMGAALFVITGQTALTIYEGVSGLNPLQIAAQIVTGVGFLGAGMIIFKDSKLQGLTTATGIWVSAGIGMAAGFGFFAISIIATILTLFIFIVLLLVERQIDSMPMYHNGDPKGSDENGLH